MPREDTQFKPGNAGGRGAPRGKRIATRLHEILDGDGKLLDAIAKVLLKEALAGDARFMSMLLDRVDGKLAAEPDPEPEVVDLGRALDQAEDAAREFREPAGEDD